MTCPIEPQLQRQVFTAAKQYTCTLCKTPIYKGQKYMRIVTLKIGTVEMMKYHEPRSENDECNFRR